MPESRTETKSWTIYLTYTFLTILYLFYDKLDQLFLYSFSIVLPAMDQI